MKNWIPLEEIDYGHFYAVLRKQWKIFNAEEKERYVALLNKFNLLSKLFEGSAKSEHPQLLVTKIEAIIFN